MIRRFLQLALVLVVSTHADNPPPIEPAEVTLASGTVPGTLEMTWPGVREHWYFLQISDNLMEEWSYLPVIESGQDETLGVGFDTTSDILFQRLQIANHWSQVPMSLDFTDSGFSNWNFIRQGLNPFDPEAPLRRMWVIETLPNPSSVEGDGTLERPATLRLVSPNGLGMPGGTLVLTIHSGPYVLLDEEGEPMAGELEKTSDAQGRISVQLRLNGFDTSGGIVRVVAGLDPTAPEILLPISVIPGEAPHPPESITATQLSESGAEITWSDTENDPVRTRYRVERDGGLLGVTQNTLWSDTLATGWSLASYTVRAEDWTGALSPAVTPVLLRNLPAGGVSTPGAPILESSGRMRATISWLPARSDHGIAAYHVRIDGQTVATSPDNRWTFLNLPSGEEIDITVQAIDQRGELSAVSPPLTVTPPADLPLALAPGAAHMVWLEADGQLFAVGSKQANAGGLHAPADPLNNDEEETLPLSASYFDRVNEVVSGEFASLILWEDGQVFQLGVITFDPQMQTNFALPIDVGSVSVERLGAGERHFFSVENGTGEVWSWGTNAQRQLGRDTPGLAETLDPAKVETAGGTPLQDVTHVTGGADFSVALMTDGTLQTWGYKPLLGRPDTTGNSETWDHPGPVLTSVSQSLGNIIAIATGESHTLALDTNGEVWSFGLNDKGQLGHGNSGSAPVLVPARVRTHDAGNPVLTQAVAVVAGKEHSLVLDANGVVWSFGASSQGQLGYLPSGGVPQLHAKPIDALNSMNIVHIAAGHYTGYAVDAEEGIHAWGLNLQGQLGDGTTTSRHAPALMGDHAPHLVFTAYKEHPTATGGIFIATARLDSDIRYTLDGSVVTETSTLFTPGAAITPIPGTLVRARAYVGSSPISLEQRWRVPTILRGAGGDGFAVALDGNGHPRAWGRSPDWRAGDSAGGGIFLDSLTNHPVRYLHVSNHSVLVSTFDGELYGWGGNENGVLLNEGSSLLHTPTLLPLVEGFVVRSAGISAWTESGHGGPHRITLKDGPDAHATGVNDKGQLLQAEGPSLQSLSGVFGVQPTPHARETVSTATGVGYVADSLGRLTAWGDWRFAGRGFRQLITPLTGDDWEPTPVALSNVNRLASGTGHVLALRGDGTVWTWGRLPEQGLTIEGAPQAVQALVSPGVEEPLSDVIEIAAGPTHSLALKADGTVWSWGSNPSGELGYASGGETVARPVPGLGGIHWIAAGKRFSMAGNAAGDIWAWGRNSHGELGDPQLSGGHTPVLVNVPVATPPLGDPSPPNPDDPPAGTDYTPPTLELPDPTPGTAPEIHIESPTDLSEIQTS